jgi:hypothetical protein
MKNIGGKLRLLLITLALSIFLNNIIYSQDLDEVVFSGTVQDQNDSLVSGAKVTAILINTGIRRSVMSDQNGYFRITDLRPGNYLVKATSKGFGTVEKIFRETNSGQHLNVNFILKPAGIVSELNVELAGSETVSGIDITKTVVGGSISENELVALPNSENDVLNLVYTLGGTSEEAFSIRNLAGDDRIGEGSENDRPSEVLGAGSISLSGGAAYSTNFTIDGLDNNDDRSADFRFQPPVDAVAEVQVITNQFSAEYGRASGGRINIRTKAGEKKFRGQFSFGFEDDNLNANTFNNNRRGLSRLPFTQYEPGGSLSGSLPYGYFKGRTFFFVSYSYRNRDALTQIFSALPVDQNPLFPIPAPTHPERARPDLNEPESVLIAPYIIKTKTPVNRHRLTGRIDHNFSDAHNMTFNYQFGKSVGFSQYRETTRFLEETLQGRIRRNNSFYLTDNLVISSKFINQIRFQYSDLRPRFATENPFHPVVLLRLRDETTIGDERINGTVVIGNSTGNFSNLREEKRYQIQETANFIFRKFNIRLGTDIQQINSSTNELRDTTGTFNFDDAKGFVSNQIVRYRRNSKTVSSLKNNYAGFFGQTDWFLRPNLTISFGLRYERETLINDKNNFAPRLAIALAPGKSGKSVIRFGGGVFYNRVLLRTIDDFVIDKNQLRFDSNRLSGTSDEPRCFTDPVFASARDECIFLLFATQNFPDPLTIEEIRRIPGIADIERGFSKDIFTRRLEEKIKIPESYQFNVGFERDLGKGFAVEVNFTFNKTVRLWREKNINAFRLPNGFADFTEYLISLGDITIPGTSSGTDTYRFILGDQTDLNGDTDAASGADCNSRTPLCLVNLNTLNGSTSTLEPIGIAKRVLQATLGRPVSNELGQIEQVGSMGKSVYEGLSFELRRRFRELGGGFGSSMRVSYVLSRNRDDGFVDTSSAQVPGDFDGEFSRSLTDRRHRLRFSGIFLLPAWLGRLNLAPVLRVESGNPFNISIGGSDRNLDDVGTDRPNFSGNLTDIVYRHPNEAPLNTLAERFSLAPIGGRGGNLSRNAGHGPALFIFDLNVSREFKFNERLKIRPNISFDNVLNATVYSFGSDFINLATAGTPEFEQGFLTPSRTLRQRKIQLGLRVYF